MPAPPQQPELQPPRDLQTASPAPEQRGRTAWQRLAQGPPEGLRQGGPPADTVAKSPEEGSTSFNEITRSLEHLRSTVANMQESLRRPPEEGATHVESTSNRLEPCGTAVRVLAVFVNYCLYDNWLVHHDLRILFILKFFFWCEKHS